jgi:hypothetical protein
MTKEDLKKEEAQLKALMARQDELRNDLLDVQRKIEAIKANQKGREYGMAVGSLVSCVYKSKYVHSKAPIVGEVCMIRDFYFTIFLLKKNGKPGKQTRMFWYQKVEISVLPAAQ